MNWPSPGLLVCEREPNEIFFKFFFSWGEGGFPGKYDAADAWAIKMTHIYILIIASSF